MNLEGGANATLTQEAAYYVLLEHHAKKTPEMTTRSPLSVSYVTSGNSSVLSLLDVGGNNTNSSLMLAPTFNEVGALNYASLFSDVVCLQCDVFVIQSHHEVSLCG